MNRSCGFIHSLLVFLSLLLLSVLLRNTLCRQTFKLLADESRADEEAVVSLWKHEMNRVVRDRLCRHADIQWFDETMKKIVEEVRHF